MDEFVLRSALSRVPGADKALPFLDIDGPVKVVMKNAAGEVLTRATRRTQVGPKRQRA